VKVTFREGDFKLLGCLRRSGGVAVYMCVCVCIYMCVFLYKGITESQNHRTVGIGRDLCGSSSPTLLLKQGRLQ